MTENKRNYRHGFTGTPIYRRWARMVERCHNPEHPAFARYGARGIRVCPRWRVSFGVFLTDMGEMPFPDAQIDRIDNARGYEPGNCRWVTRTQNMNNRTDNRYIEHDGEKLTLADWGRRTGIAPATIAQRIKKGWSVDRALTEPVKKTLARIIAHGN